jgi:putative flippase GtrA
MKFLRFLVVGAFSALVQLIVLGLCLQLLNFEYQLSAVLAYIASVVFHFLANRYLTFRLRGVPRIREIGRYMTIVLVNFMITMTITTLTVEFVNLYPQIRTLLTVRTVNLVPYLGTFFSISTTICVTFISSKYWIFKQRKLA